MSIDTDLIYDVRRLVGKQVKILPYARGYVPRDTLFRLWKTMEDDEIADFVFHSHLENGTPYKTAGDLVEFMKMFDPDAKRFLLIILSVEGDIILGATWFDDVIVKHKASMSIFMIKGHRGDTAAEAAKISLDYAFNALDMKMIWAFTPWPHAVNLAKKVGFKPIATLPEILPQQYGNKDMHILRIKREEF